MRSDVSRTIVERSALRRSSTSSGGARRDRTDDLMLAKHALSQLSYGPVTRRRMLHSIKVVGLGRLELPTSRLSSARSNQLSYKPLTLSLFDQGSELAKRAGAWRRSIATAQSPWRVFVREERETKTAKSRQWSSTILKPLAPECF
jgi:hypothetical protein